VTASVGNGYWPAWWPTEVLATEVRGIDASGDVVETLEVPQ
jgi:hypothetical protein